MNTLHVSNILRPLVGIATVALLSACGVSKVTEDAIVRAETKYQQAQQALGNSEGGAMELQRANSHLQQAKDAAKSGDEKPAQQHAQRAELDVDLAVAKAQNASVRKANDELQASIQQIRQEAQRSGGTSR
jgi:chromosome segregation ATPase